METPAFEADSDSVVEVLLEESGAVVKVPVRLLNDVRRLDGGYYLEVSFVGNRGYTINAPELELKLHQLGIS